jgi:competence protein ComEC
VLGPLHPPTVIDPEDGTSVNDGSLVLRASTPAGTALLTGDVELAAQADLVASGADLRADVLKMPQGSSRWSWFTLTRRSTLSRSGSRAARCASQAW